MRRQVCGRIDKQNNIIFAQLQVMMFALKGAASVLHRVNKQAQGHLSASLKGKRLNRLTSFIFPTTELADKHKDTVPKYIYF